MSRSGSKQEAESILKAVQGTIPKALLLRLHVNEHGSAHLKNVLKSGVRLRHN